MAKPANVYLNRFFFSNSSNVISPDFSYKYIPIIITKITNKHILNFTQKKSNIFTMSLFQGFLL